ncbi:uncharacterized protein FMAN_15471 [Fusarium mangiferae]|uniref:Protein kinase domain-containing protein n=1 Tax=Fusarium mangiferae TaxID=192010 RepID=A0A1L7UNE6_FUSMA|nr:uncharacterized protein FMAN_15471 [Fusarium mangiferae]CVL09297.1 uncharacterized protein FMAN_15471 [Fusarium mangiferae]
MIPVKRADADAVAPVLVPVLPGSPWKYYVKGLFVKHWCLIAIAIRKRSGKDDRIDRDMYMIRSPPSLKAEKLQIIRQIRHLNVVDNIEIFSEDDGNCYIVSQMMETSLLHIRRAPDYPSESQLSCILFQV